MQRTSLTAFVCTNNLDDSLIHVERDARVKGSLQCALGTLDGDSRSIDLDLNATGDRHWTVTYAAHTSPNLTQDFATDFAATSLTVGQKTF